MAWGLASRALGNPAFESVTIVLRGTRQLARAVSAWRRLCTASAAGRWGRFLAVLITSGGFAMVHSEQLGQAWGPLLVLFVVGLVSDSRTSGDSIRHPGFADSRGLQPHAFSFALSGHGSFSPSGAHDAVFESRITFVEAVSLIRDIVDFLCASARQDLLRLLAAKSFRLGQFKLSSGGTSDYYIDCRTTTLAAKGARLTGQVFLDEIRSAAVEAQGHRRPDHGRGPDRGRVSVASGDMDGFLVRKAEKQHGTGRRIEGFQEKGARVVIVDDVCTTGSSTIQAIEAAREFGFEVVGVMCLVERRRPEGVPRGEGGGSGAICFVFTATDVRQEHLLQNDETSPGNARGGRRLRDLRTPGSVHSPRIRCEEHKN